MFPSQRRLKRIRRRGCRSGPNPNCHRCPDAAELSLRMPERMPEVPLTREQAIERLVSSEPDIRALGVQRLALFGSVARGQARPDSDVDLLV